jgi:spore coat protein U-like protein
MNPIAQVQQRRLQLALVSAFALGAFAISGSAAAANTASATATTTVVTPISITKATDLAFGSIAAGATSGTVTVDTNGTRSVFGGVIATGGTVTAAKFDIVGSASLAYGITYDSNVTLTGTGAPMALTQISDLSGSGGASSLAASGTLSAGGTQSLYIGGTLAVAANQLAGAYTATINALVNYQ